MSENKLKVGDRVRIVADVEQPYQMWVEKGDTGVLVDGEHADGFECVNLDGCANKSYVCVENKYLETDAIYDPKIAFLSELKKLLEKYGAEIELLSYDLDTTQLGITSDDFEVEYPIDVQQITAKNIMDYDRE